MISLRFDTSLSGSLNNFSLENLKLTSDQGIKIIGDLNLINAVKQEDFYLTSNFEELSLDYFKLKNLLPNLLENSLPNRVN